MGIRQQKKSRPIETRYRGGKLDTSSGSSKLNYITNLMTRPWDFGYHLFTHGWEIGHPSFKII